jgi:hypothetical protein
MKNRAIYQTILVSVFLFIFLNNQVFGQNEDEVTWRDRLFFGGNLALVVGDITIIEITPLVGYRITSLWSAGIGLKYEYYKSSGRSFGSYNVSSYSTSIYGGSLFTNYVFLKNFPTDGISLMAQTEYEALSLEKRYFQDPNANGRFLLNTVLLGGGIRQRLGQRSSLNLLLLWNLTETKYSPYNSNPILKFSFNF